MRKFASLKRFTFLLACKLVVHDTFFLPHSFKHYHISAQASPKSIVHLVLVWAAWSLDAFTIVSIVLAAFTIVLFTTVIAIS